jgi:acetylornithine deacetylase/succinyl-diaminopimelate desuccinylase-like protein
MGKIESWNDEMTQKWIETTSRWVSYQATESNTDGLKKFFDELSQWLGDIGFEMEFHIDEDAPYRPVIIAKRPPQEGFPWVGFFQHYDVEPIHSEWKTDPWNLIQKGERVYGRGIADNIGPLAQRLLLFESMETDVGLLFVIQGEEEIGSPWAHELFAGLQLPEVELWVDETGYFYSNGDQRILVVGEGTLVDSIIENLTSLNSANGRGTKVRSRFMTKAFGLENCPCIAHLLGDSPYLAIGPNDDKTRVHGPNESMDINLLPICSEHLVAVLEAVKP